jgi:hypothetical protein
MRISGINWNGWPVSMSKFYWMERNADGALCYPDIPPEYEPDVTPYDLGFNTVQEAWDAVAVLFCREDYDSDVDWLEDHPFLTDWAIYKDPDPERMMGLLAIAAFDTEHRKA